MTEIGENTEKSPGDLIRLDVSQTPADGKKLSRSKHTNSSKNLLVTFCIWNKDFLFPKSFSPKLYRNHEIDLFQFTVF